MIIRFKNKRGFSAVELIVVIAILSLFAMIIYPVVYYSSHISVSDNIRSNLLAKGQYALNFIEREVRDAQRVTRIESSNGKATLEILRWRNDLSYKRIFEEFSFDNSAGSQADWLRFRKGLKVNENSNAGFAKIIDGVDSVIFEGYNENGATTSGVNFIYSVGISITIKDKYNRVNPITVYGRVTLRTHHNLVHMYVYYDETRTTSWISRETAKETRLFFEDRGFNVVNADSLQDAMLKAIIKNDAARTVVVMSQDVVPDTVAEYAIRADTDNHGNLKYKIVKNNPTQNIPYFCLIRQFMNAGGRVVWYGDIPFYYVDESGSRIKWDADGSKDILGVGAWTNNSDSHDEVKITKYGSENDGYNWGLSRKWESIRPTYPKYLNYNEKRNNQGNHYNGVLNYYLNSGFSTILAVDSKEYASAYYRNYDVSHPGSGFVRIFDRAWSDISIGYLQDMFRVATYETTFYLPFKHVVYYDSLFPSSWISKGSLTSPSSAEHITEYLHKKGFFTLDAQQLQAFMQNAIFYNTNDDASDNSKPYSYTVVVFSQDIAPDTVSNVEKDTAIIRRYINSDKDHHGKYGKGGNGRVVWMADVPFYYQGHYDGSKDAWGDGGSKKILGFDAAGGDWDDGAEVTITSGGSSDYGNGEDWGLQTKWNSYRPEEEQSYFLIPPQPQNVDENLAYYDIGGWFVSYREFSAWFKKYGANEKGGFVRIWDCNNIGSLIQNSNSLLDELKSVSLYKWP